jgi:hypothetical protein
MWIRVKKHRNRATAVRKPRTGPSRPFRVAPGRRTRMAQAALVVLLALSLHAGGSGVAQAVAVVASCVCRCKLEEQALRAGPRSREPQRSHRGRALRVSAASWPTACGSGFRGGNQVAAPRHCLMLTGSAYAAAPLLRRGPCHAQQQICTATERMRRHAVATSRRGGHHAPQGGREKEQSPG